MFVSAVFSLLPVALFFPAVRSIPPEPPRPCSPLCSSDPRPVCAHHPIHGYRNFRDRCSLDNEIMCKKGGWVFIHIGECTTFEIDLCTNEYKPVCGDSPTKGRRTFNNLCYLNFENVCKGGDYKFIQEGKCPLEAALKACPLPCPKIYNPVCGYSHTLGFKTFGNPCVMNSEVQCSNADYILAHSGECTPAELGKGVLFNTDDTCKRNCLQVYDPVCAQSPTYGWKTFSSSCELRIASNCNGEDYSFVHQGKCTDQERGGTCNHECLMFYLGVCAYSNLKGYKTFPNECFLDRENTCSHTDYKVAHPGKCTPAETGGVCNLVCQDIYSPVCGRSSVNGYKTFSNFCYLDRENSCEYQDYVFIHQGECFPWELCDKCH